MSFGLQSSFKFTWILQDIDSWFTHRDYVRSPFFTSEKVLNETSWCIYLHGLKESMCEDSLCLNLFRRDNLTRKIRLHVSMYLLMPNGQLQLVDKQMKYIFESGQGIRFNLGRSFQTLRELFYDDKLTIQCEIINPSELVVYPEHFTARTHLGTEVINCMWMIHSLFSFPTFSSPFPIIHDASHRLEIKGIGWVRNYLIALPSNDAELLIKIGTVDDKIPSSAHVEGEISLLNSEKEIVLSADSRHIFLSGDQKKIWNFVIPFSKKDIVETCDVGPTNEELSFICKFTFYTMMNESFEYTILPRSCHNSVCKRAKGNELISAQLVKGLEKLNVIEDVQHHLQEDLQDLYLRKRHSDVVLKAGIQSFPSHRIILCSRSPVFKDMFDQDFVSTKKEEVTIDLEADTLDQFLLFLYSEKLENLRWESAVKLLHAANKFQVESLKTECCSFLKSQFCVFNICEALELAFKYQDNYMRKECEKFIFQEASGVFSSKEWKAFTLKNPSFSSDITKRYFNRKK